LDFSTHFGCHFYLLRFEFLNQCSASDHSFWKDHVALSAKAFQTGVIECFDPIHPTYGVTTRYQQLKIPWIKKRSMFLTLEDFGLNSRDITEGKHLVAAEENIK
jgi:hypothetical protein